MYIISPENHETANKVWRELLGSRPNGARTLGEASAKYLSDEMAKHYDMFVTYCVNFPFEIPDGVKRIAVMWHQNFPWVDGFKLWQTCNIKLAGYEVDYFVNEHKMVDLIREVGGRAYFLPRFIDTTTLPEPVEQKTIPVLWFGNKWGEFKGEFEEYKNSYERPAWVTQGNYGIGDKVLRENISHEQALEIVARAKTVWAIGISQLEAKALGAEIISYRGQAIPLYTEKTAPLYLRRLLNEIWSERTPSSGK